MNDRDTDHTMLTAMAHLMRELRLPCQSGPTLIYRTGPTLELLFKQAFSPRAESIALDAADTEALLQAARTAHAAGDARHPDLLGILRPHLDGLFVGQRVPVGVGQ